MDTEVIKADAEEDDGGVAHRGAERLRRGGLVAFPTETVYGVGARADHVEAVQRLRAVKSRESDKAFTVHLGRADDAARFAPDLAGLATRFIRKAWPGPLTLILPVNDPSSVPAMARLNGSAAAAMYYRNSVGLRCPSHAMTQALLGQVDAPVVAASANLAGRPAPVTAEEVLAELAGQIDLVIDGGRTQYGRPSTIVRVTGPTYTLVREGVFDAGIVERLSTLSVLLVCTGNTCRSPMAAAIARKMLAARIGCDVSELKARGIVVRSAGTAGGGGGASPHAVTVMGRRGLDVTDHASVTLTPDMIRQADYIFAMTRAHRDTIVSMLPSAEDRVRLLAGDEDIQDPIGGTEETYEECAKKVEQGLRRCLPEIIP